MYRYQHGKPITVNACAQRLSTILYSKRFFPYYAHAILGGLDEEYIPGSGEGHALERRTPAPLPQDTVEELVRDAFTSAVERHIEVGDGLQMMIITKDGIQETYTPLKKD